MRAILVFALVLVASASAYVEVQKGYHEEIGIPLYQKIKTYEESLPAESLEAYLDERIVGGAIAAVGAHPYFGGLLINFWNIAGQSVCGSSLLSANRLVTAAHCWFDGRNQASQFTVILGSNFLLSGGTRIATQQVVMHPLYNFSNLNNDVAMIYLPTSVFISTLISPIALPNSWELWDQFVGQQAIAAGFGRTSDQQAGASSIVSDVTLRVIPIAECAPRYIAGTVIPSTLCTDGTGGVGVCGGDSGGPLALQQNGRPVLIGISSFVASTGCQLGFPSGFARVTSFMDFITQHM